LLVVSTDSYYDTWIHEYQIDEKLYLLSTKWPDVMSQGLGLSQWLIHYWRNNHYTPPHQKLPLLPVKMWFS